MRQICKIEEGTNSTENYSFLLLRFLFSLPHRKSFQLLSHLLALSLLPSPFFSLSSISCLNSSHFVLSFCGFLAFRKQDGKQLRLWTLISKVSMCIPDPWVVAASSQLQLLHQNDTGTGIYLQGLSLFHEKMYDPFILMLQKLLHHQYLALSILEGHSLKQTRITLLHLLKVSFHLPSVF